MWRNESPEVFFPSMKQAQEETGSGMWRNAVKLRLNHFCKGRWILSLAYSGNGWSSFIAEKEQLGCEHDGGLYLTPGIFGSPVNLGYNSCHLGLLAILAWILGIEVQNTWSTKGSLSLASAVRVCNTEKADKENLFVPEACNRETKNDPVLCSVQKIQDQQTGLCTTYN